MSKFIGWYNKEYDLLPCPFCGGEAKVFQFGNDYLTKKKTVKIRCKNCRCKRVNATTIHSFEWLEKIAVKSWNQRPIKDPEIKMDKNDVIAKGNGFENFDEVITMTAEADISTPRKAAYFEAWKVADRTKEGLLKLKEVDR